MAAPRDIARPRSSDCLAFLHCNAQSARNKDDELTMFLGEFRFKFQVIMITETWYSCEGDVLSLPGYKSFFLNRHDRRGGGVLQFVSEQLSCSLLSDFSKINIDYEALTLQYKTYVFAVIYRPPNGNLKIFFDFLDRLLDFVSTNGLRVIIGGDCNINLLQNTAATREFQVLIESFSCRNVISEPTRISCHSESLLDLFLTNNMNDDVTSGRVITCLSDHFPIYMSFKDSEFFKGKARHTESYIMREINAKTLEIFRGEITNIDWSIVLESTNAEEAYEHFIAIIKQVYYTCFKLKEVRKSKKLRKPWMSDDCFRMVKKRDVLYSKFVKTRNLNDLSKFKKYRNFVTKVLRSAKKAYYENVFSSTQSEVVWREIHKLLNCGSHHNEELRLTVNNKTVVGNELADAFNKYFTNLVSVVSGTDSSGVKRFLGTPNSNTAFFAPTTCEEICSTFMTLKNSKARDIDDLEIKPIKFVLDILAPVLCYIFNTCLLTGTFPESMQRARVSVLFKSGDKNDFSNYRPVSVLPVISKGLEKIICKRVSSFCDKHSILTERQFGFRRGMSTELALLTQKEFILNGFENNKLTLGIFIDFSKAFDRVNHVILSTKLDHYGFRGIPGDLLKSYLTHRKQCVVINEKRSPLLSVHSGVPQGSVLGPVLFNIYINDIINSIECTNCLIYADDTSLFFQSNNINDLVSLANVTLNKLLEWTRVNVLEINVSKTKAVLFAPVQKLITRDINIQLGSEMIKVTNEAKTLGITFNQHLSWNAHVDRVAGTLAKACGILCRFRQILTTKVKLMLYNSLFASHINYCNLVWGVTSQANKTKLHLLQKKAIRHIVNAPYDAHTKELFASLNVLPFQHLYNFNLIMKYKLSIKNNNSTFIKLCNLKRPHDASYNIRKKDSWLVPFSRTNHGLDRLQHRMPSCLNSLEKRNLDIHTICKKTLKEHFFTQ